MVNKGKDLFLAIKATEKAGFKSFKLPVGSPVKALIRPIPTLAGYLDEVDIELLTNWRNKYVKSFLTEFSATNERTAIWLKDTVHFDQSKMLFMVESLDGERLGHVGIGFINWNDSYCEADAIVSGGQSPNGLMKESLQTLLDWAKDILALKNIAVRVRSDNSAVDFYRKVGFQEFKRIPIVPKKVNDGVSWKEDVYSTIPEPSLVYMKYKIR